MRVFLPAALVLLAVTIVRAEDRVLFDFESGTYAGWRSEGKAFGAVPAAGALADQGPVSGHCGRRLANSFRGGDAARGRLVSEPFRITHRHLRFFVGGGDDTGLVVRLEIDKGPVLEATGARSERLRPVVWNLTPWRDRHARLVLADVAEGPWRHLLADHFALTDDATGGPPVSVGPRYRAFDPGMHEGKRIALNDHCFVRDRAGLWHVFAITFTEPGAPSIDGRLFAHATSPSLAGGPWKAEAHTLEIDPQAGETRLWAPHVVRDGGRWWMYYHAGGSDERRSRIHLATSRDLLAWRRHDANPLFTDGFQARDPWLVRVGDRWHLYYTATFPREGGHHTVAVRKSRDLRSWSEPQDVYRDPRIGTDFGPTESPFVLQRGAYWYLFVGSSVPEEYDVTRVFRSREPLNWAPSDLVARLRVHGAEIVRDEQGRWFASHAGNGRGGLWFARLHWSDGLDEDGQPLD